MKVCITGGHLTPALSVIEEIKSTYPSWEIVFIGRRFAMEGDKVASEEYRVIHDKKIRFFPLTTGRLVRFMSLSSVLSLLKIPIGFIQAFFYCIRERPQVIASFGGYVALPIVIAGSVLGIPTVTHEQTLAPGLANRIISFFATVVCINSESVKKYFPAKKIAVTGMMIRKSLFTIVYKDPFRVSEHTKILYVTGGSTGSESVNELMYPILSRLLKNYVIIHQVGQRSLDHATHIREKLTLIEKIRYIVLPYLDEKEHAWAMQHAHIILGRSGASITAEVEALGKVAVFIPLPWASFNEQYLNAKRLVDMGSSVIFDQKNARPKDLLDRIEKTDTQWDIFHDRARLIAGKVSHNGAERFVSQLVRFEI